jgi:hypothetical protein
MKCTGILTDSIILSVECISKFGEKITPLFVNSGVVEDYFRRQTTMTMTPVLSRSHLPIWRQMELVVMGLVH